VVCCVFIFLGLASSIVVTVLSQFHALNISLSVVMLVSSILCFNIDVKRGGSGFYALLIAMILAAVFLLSSIGLAMQVV
jgi:hypothetical protein